RGFQNKLPLLRLFVAMPFVLTFVSVFFVAGAYFQRNYIFPDLCTFDTFGLDYFIETRNAELELTSPPTEWKNHRDGRVARVTFLKATYPDVAFDEPFPNWTGYQNLEFEVFSPADTALRLTIRIEDIHHNDLFEDRYTKSFTVTPGFNIIKIPLDSVKIAPAGRLMDMQNIYAIHLHAFKIERPVTVYFDSLRLR
ncbi:MAG: hypothetical protein ACOYVF_05470, partial [Candidatus Zixiibacteriota bacterium]